MNIRYIYQEIILKFTINFQSNCLEVTQLSRCPGLGGSGKGQSQLALLSHVTYYTSVRAVTRIGNVLESTSDGFVVDTTMPSLAITSIGGEPLNTSIDTLYWREAEYFSADWATKDPESGIDDVWYQMGTYPGRKKI